MAMVIVELTISRAIPSMGGSKHPQRWSENGFSLRPVSYLPSRNRFSAFASSALMKLCACVNKSSIDTGGRAMRSLRNLPGRCSLMKAPVIIPSEQSVMCNVSFPNLPK
nr:hypothetical protein [Tanacetum cinerariifolium]